MGGNIVREAIGLGPRKWSAKVISDDTGYAGKKEHTPPVSQRLIIPEAKCLFMLSS